MNFKTGGPNPPATDASNRSVVPTMFSYNINAAVRTLNLALYGKVHVHHFKDYPTLKMVVVGFSKKVVNLYKTKRCGIQKEILFSYI